MSKFFTRIFLWIVLCAIIESEPGSECEKKMEEAKIIPNYADYGTSGDLEVVFEGDYRVNCGDYMPILETKDSPTVTYDVKGKCENVSIVFFDPDIPVTKKRIFLHWFVSNIPAEEMRKGYDKKKGKGRENSPYFPSGAPTGNHRYTFCVYCQSRYLTRSSDIRNFSDRLGVHPRCLAMKNGLGNSEACTFYYSAVFDSDLKNSPGIHDVGSALKQLGNRDM